MHRRFSSILTLALLLTTSLSACGPTRSQLAGQPLRVLAVETFLADIAQNVAGERLMIDTLMPIGIDPHAFSPTPRDVTLIAESQILIINGAHFEDWLDETLKNAGGKQVVLEASAGLNSRTPGKGEALDPDHVGDPHFWLDPNNAIHYAENIRDGLSAADPEGKSLYAQNTENYIQQLKELDGWIRSQIDQIPSQKRLLVTNHESFGYFADRYGFTVIGTVIPSTSSEASPTARQMAELIDRIKQYSIPVIFLETGSNPNLAEQIAAETGAKVVTDLYTHSITKKGGPAASYIEMIRHNVNLLMQLK